MRIVSILFDKEKYEYTIKRKDIAGNIQTVKANRLNDEEKQWARSCEHYNQTPYFISWC